VARKDAGAEGLLFAQDATPVKACQSLSNLSRKAAAGGSQPRSVAWEAGLDEERADRAMQAMLKMQKLDIGALRKAYES